MFEAYSKNAKVDVFTSPFPIEDVPSGAKILNSKVAFKVKDLDADDTWDLYSRHCANGSIQTEGIDFCSSYAAIVTSDSIRTCLALVLEYISYVHLII